MELEHPLQQGSEQEEGDPAAAIGGEEE